MTTEHMIVEIAKKARRASRQIAAAETREKNQALLRIAEMLDASEADITAANQKDLEFAKEKGLTSAMMDRLKISRPVLDAMIKGLEEVAALPDPVGETARDWVRPNGLKISKIRIPLGVIAMIYESRPNVTVDAAALCFKSGNCALLRGGSEAFHSNMILADIIGAALDASGFNRNIVQVVPTRDREAVTSLLKQEEWIDLVIPRGGEPLIRFVVQNSTIPVLKHYKGVCHVYVDKTFDMNQAVDICMNSKTQRPGVCNAMETLLVHEQAAGEFLPVIMTELQNKNVEIRGCEKTRALFPHVKKAETKDWHEEYLDFILAVRIVDSMEQAMDHIEEYGSNHTDVIVTNDDKRAETFVKNVFSSMVGVNASTRFNDGGELGLGAEIGISTSKLHAFGPMGLEELTTTKFVVKGSGQIRT